MRIGVVSEPNSNALYRALQPVRAMELRGHAVERSALYAKTREAFAPLRSCDVVHVYRRYDRQVHAVITDLRRAGVGVVWDNDDDFSLIDPSSPTFRTSGGLKGESVAKRMLRVARLASVVTTTTEPLAERYRGWGIDPVTVIPNAVAAGLRRPSNRHAGIVIGWVAGWEHEVDARQLRIAAALEAMLAAHPDVRVETIGVALGLRERYRHDRLVEFGDLPIRMAGWDIAIAPLADTAFNRMRSDIKLKEYAASGLAWLASPVGPYADLGERQGGRLVADGAWERELDRLIRSRRDRRRLAKSGGRWARAHAIEAYVDAWEAVFTRAAGDLRSTNVTTLERSA